MAGPATGGALLAHTMAGLLDGRRSLSHPPCSFAPFQHRRRPGLLAAAASTPSVIRERRVLLADDVRNTGKTLERCAALVREAGGEVVGSVQIYDRLEAVVDLGVPNVALIEYTGAGELRRGELSAVPRRRASHAFLDSVPRQATGVVAHRDHRSWCRLEVGYRPPLRDAAALKATLDGLYESFNVAESAADPVEIIRRYRESGRSRDRGVPRLRAGLRPRRERAGLD